MEKRYERTLKDLISRVCVEAWASGECLKAASCAYVQAVDRLEDQLYREDIGQAETTEILAKLEQQKKNQLSFMERYFGAVKNELRELAVHRQKISDLTVLDMLPLYRDHIVDGLKNRMPIDERETYREFYDQCLEVAVKEGIISPEDSKKDHNRSMLAAGIGFIAGIVAGGLMEDVGVGAIGSVAGAATLGKGYEFIVTKKMERRLKKAMAPHIEYFVDDLMQGEKQWTM
jgi:hypothetical protein